MRTVRSSGRLSGGCLLQGGGVSAPGGCLLLGVSVPGGCLLQGVCSWGMSALGGGGGVCSGGSGIPACTEADTPPRVDRQTPVKT